MNLLAVWRVASMTIGLSVQPPSNVPAPVPPPPIIREEPKPVTPSRIKVGGSVQAVYWGPAAYWSRGGGPHRLAAGEIERAEHTLASNPGDLCVRGRLIAFVPAEQDTNNPPFNRLSHLLWMVRNHPEWDGFSVDPLMSISDLRGEQSSIDLLRETWILAASETRSALGLHNAAMFFALNEPGRAVELMDRAIRLKPDEPFFIERLGLIYAYSQVNAERLKRFGLVPNSDREAFAEQAQQKLAQSNDRLLLSSAANALRTLIFFGLFDDSIRETARVIRERGMLLPATPITDSELKRNLGRACAARSDY